MDLGKYGDADKREEVLALLIAFKRHPELLTQGICSEMLELYNRLKDEIGDDMDGKE